MAAECKGHVDALRPGGAPLVVQPRRRRASVPLERDVGRARHLARGRAPRRRPSAPRRARRRPRSALCRRSSAKRAASKSQASRSTVYPGARVTITDASPSTPRSRDTYSCTMCRALAGACSPQTESTSASTDTTSPTSEEQDAEQCSLAATRQVHTATVDQRLERAENPKGDLRHGTNQDRTVATGLPARDGAAMERRWSGFATSSGPCAHSQSSSPRHFAATAPAATPARAASGNSAAEYSLAVTRICAGALLFDHAHDMGTRADALSVARDIRASTARRLARVTALSAPPELQYTSSRWISSQRRLASLYARTWVQIYDTIDAARTPAQLATLAARLQELVHAPDPLKLAAGRLELELHVPDCTGGG